MRVVDRQTFLALPPGTLFMKVPEQPRAPNQHDLGFSDEVQVKWETMSKDFVCQNFVPWFEGAEHSGDWADKWIELINGMGTVSATLDYECAGRDGLYDENQLFAVWEREDHLRLIKMLMHSFECAFEGKPDAD